MKAPKKTPSLLRVSEARYITPHMVRITLNSEKIKVMQAGCEGANCKIFLPRQDQSFAEFSEQLNGGPRPVVRTYTVRHIRPDIGEMDIDFVDHGEGGPASAWARDAKVGSFCGFAGPGSVKVPNFYADRYLIVADMSALPVAAATLEAMPKDAVGDAFFEVTHQDDMQPIEAPAGIRQHWLVHPSGHAASAKLISAVQAWDWPVGIIQTCIAGESSVITALRSYINVERGVSKDDCYISGYWKVGLIEDEHQLMKRVSTQ